MKISEACERAGVTSTTLKYYIQEKLVPEGERVGVNKTEYGEIHVQRAKLARALIEIGRLSVATSRQVLAALDAHEDSLAHVFEVAQRALTADGNPGAAPSAESRQRVDELIGAQSWSATAGNPGHELAAAALDGFAASTCTPSADYLATYADAAAAVARADLAALREQEAPAAIAELMVVGTVMGDRLFAGLRRLAHQHETTLAFPVEEDAHREDADRGDQS